MLTLAMRVFLSHTSELREHPPDLSFAAAAEAAISRAGDVVINMAYFTARDSPASDYCMQMVAAADVYVAVIGLRYGSKVRDRPDLSYTELEFELATRSGIPRLIFLLDENAVLPLPASQIVDLEFGLRQAAFRGRLMEESGPTVARVTSPWELETKLYQALVERRELRDPAPAAGAPITVPLGRLPSRVRGRTDLLRWLRQQRGLVVLTGMGGIGKSTVAAELARQTRRHRDPVWWVSAADGASLAACILTLARSIGAGDADLNALARQAGDGPDRLWALLEQADEGWLLVLDNADDPSVLAARGSTVGDGNGWARANGRGLVVVTSRRGDEETWGRQARIRRLTPLREADAAQVLLDAAPHAGDRAQAVALGRRLGGLPLALHLAGVYLRSHVARWSSFAAYTQALDSESPGARLLRPDPGSPRVDDPRATVLCTWELSLDDLARHGMPHARTVLRLLSCFASAIPIPFEMLDPVVMALLPPLVPAPEEGQADAWVEKALRGLARLSLIDTIPGQQAVVVHPVIADTSRAQLEVPTGSDPDPALVWHTAVRLVTGAMAALDWASSSDWPRFGRLTPHLFAVTRGSNAHLDPEDLVSLLEAYRRLTFAHNYGVALPEASYLTRAAPLHTSEFGENQACILHSFVDAQVEMVKPLGSWVEIESALRQVLSTRASVLGDHHPEVVAIRHNLGRALACQERVVDCEAVFREVLDAKRQIFGFNHPETLSTRTNLALIAARLGRWDEAGRELQAILEVYRRELGDDHPATITTSHCVAWTTANQGRWVEAECGFRQVLDARRRVFGDNTAITLVTHHELAWTVAGQARWVEAEALFREVLDAKRHVLGDSHPDTLATRHNLAWTIASQGRSQEAYAMFLAVLEVKQRVLGDDHRFTLTTRRAFEANAMPDEYHGGSDDNREISRREE